jgi:transposase
MQRRSFSREFKVEAVRLVRERDVSVAQAARDLDVHENVLRKWVQQLADDPLEAFPGSGKMKAAEAEIERLRREVQKLKAERDILKKAAAYFAKDQTSCLRSWRSTGGFGRRRGSARRSVSRAVASMRG